MYIEDALGDRIWVDLDSCKELVANMCTLFATKPCNPLGNIATTGGGGKNSGETTKGASGESSEGSTCDTGEFSKEVVLSGIETAPRFVYTLLHHLLSIVEPRLCTHVI